MAKQFSNEFFAFNLPDFNEDTAIIYLKCIKAPVVSKSGRLLCQVVAEFRNKREQAEVLEILGYAREQKLIGQLKSKGRFIHFRCSALILN